MYLDICNTLVARNVIKETYNYLLHTNYSFRFVVLPSSTYLFTVGVEFVYFSLDHTQTHNTIGRSRLDEGSARRRDLYLTTQTLTRDEEPCPRWDSNPQCQQTNARRGTVIDYCLFTFSLIGLHFSLKVKIPCF
jgi:hypothetical protein